MPKEHLRQLFWRSTDLTFLQIIIVASRPTLPFSWGGGRRFVTGRRQIKDRCRETMDLHQALQTSDKSTTTASYAFNHIPKPLSTVPPFDTHTAQRFNIRHRSIRRQAHNHNFIFELVNFLYSDKQKNFSQERLVFELPQMALAEIDSIPNRSYYI